jgi:type IV pilus assembly protein PilN
MIKISLVPLKRSKKRDAAKRELAIGGGLLAFIIIVLYVFYAVMDSKLSQADESIQRRRSDTARLEKDILKVDEFKKKKHELESKLTVIDDLKAKKTGPVKMLDELASNIPKRVWLQSFDERNQNMTLEGAAADNEDLSDFLAYLSKRSHYFGQVTLAYSEKVQPEKGAPDRFAFVRFKLTGTANYGTQPAAAAPTAEKGK